MAKLFCHVPLLVNFAMEIVREIIFYKNHFELFYKRLPGKVRKKVDYVLYMISVTEHIPSKFFKSIENANGLFEVRIEYGSNIYRVFCCFETGRLLVLFNGFQKKSQRTPNNELEKAKQILDEYFNEKNTK